MEDEEELQEFQRLAMQLRIKDEEKFYRAATNIRELIYKETTSDSSKRTRTRSPDLSKELNASKEYLWVMAILELVY